jgi:nitric oxide reductase subunit C
MQGTRVFFALCLLVALALVIVLPALGGAFISRTVPDDVARGFGLWRAYDCAGCHTLNGQGGAYAPDLTRIYRVRGENYLREFLINPGAFHPNAIRIMPRLGLTAAETGDVLAFLKWADEKITAFPLRPIHVSGGLPDGAALSVSPDASTSADTPDDPVAAGRFWIARPPANCVTCHSLQPDVVLVGPSLAGVATRAATRVPGMSAEDYLRQSILEPGAYVVEGFPDAMARNLGEVLTSQKISEIIAFLLTQTETEAAS